MFSCPQCGQMHPQQSVSPVSEWATMGYLCRSSRSSVSSKADYHAGDAGGRGSTGLFVASQGRCTLETAMARQSAGKQTLHIEGVDVPVSNLDKLLYPAAGVTKAHVVDYYIRVSNWLLPHLRDRPVT
jgi:hypothetical protein